MADAFIVWTESSGLFNFEHRTADLEALIAQLRLLSMTRIGATGLGRSELRPCEGTSAGQRWCNECFPIIDDLERRSGATPWPAGTYQTRLDVLQAQSSAGSRETVELNGVICSFWTLADWIWTKHDR